MSGGSLKFVPHFLCAGFFLLRLPGRRLVNLANRLGMIDISAGNLTLLCQMLNTSISLEKTSLLYRLPPTTPGQTKLFYCHRLINLEPSSHTIIAILPLIFWPDSQTRPRSAPLGPLFVPALILDAWSRCVPFAPLYLEKELSLCNLQFKALCLAA